MRRSLDATVVVPVKPWRLAKSRLSVSPDLRASLAEAFALDTLAAVAGSAHVGQLVIVTAELGIGAASRQHGAVVLADRPMMAPDGLNGAIHLASRWARARRRRSPFVVVPGDMPSLTPDVLDQALERLSTHASSFVPDVRHKGTTLLWNTSPPLETCYGTDSAALHTQSGMVAVQELDIRASLDVDTREDLAEARRWGVGRQTSSVISGLTSARG